MKGVAFFHLQKTGGANVKRNIKLNRFGLCTQVDGIEYKFKDQSLRVASNRIMFRLQAKYVFGHMVSSQLLAYFSSTFGYQYDQFAILREPNRRILSHYNYLINLSCRHRQEKHGVLKNGKIVSLSEWVKTYPLVRNNMVRFLYERLSNTVNEMNCRAFTVDETHLAFVVKQLEKFNHVAILEKPESMDILYKLMNIFPIKRIGHSGTPSVTKNQDLEFLSQADVNDLDMILYQTILRRQA